MIIKKKIQAGALQVVLFVAVIIAIIVSSFILLVHFHNRFDVHTDFINKSVENAQLGINYALVNDISVEDSLILDFDFKDYESVSITKNYWGIFERITSTSKTKNNVFRKTALTGGRPQNENRTALYLEDNNKPLVVVGNTKIEGSVFLPKQGVKPGNIAGQSYYGTQLIYGDIRRSNNLHDINNNLLSSIGIKDAYSSSQYLDIDKSRIHKNSFYNKKQIIYSNSDISLSEITLIGHIEVVSKTKITLDKSAVLKDVVLMAPEIIINDDTEGTFQAISTEKITLGRNCKLYYPSAIVLKSKIETNQDSNNSMNYVKQIVMSENSLIEGLVVFSGSQEENNFKPQISVAENSFVNGEIYCEGNLELKGTVFGSVYTSNFVANESGSIYQNHIYNANIIADELEENFVGLLIENSNKGIAKWLY